MRLTGRKVAGGIGVATLILAGGAFVDRYFSKQALAECFRPTTVIVMPLAVPCVPSNETPPRNLMRIVEVQASDYHLQLQKVIVCRSDVQFPQFESEFVKMAFTDEVRGRWLPLDQRCCSYQYLRHVAVVVRNGSDRGSVVVEAALIQSRWAYLLSNGGKNRTEWN